MNAFWQNFFLNDNPMRVGESLLLRSLRVQHGRAGEFQCISDAYAFMPLGFAHGFFMQKRV